MKSSPEGLGKTEAARRLAESGPNVISESKLRCWAWRLLIAARNPLVILLIVLCTISFFTKDLRSGTVMTLMVVLSVLLRFVQESRADAAAAKPKAMINVSATVIRDGRRPQLDISHGVIGRRTAREGEIAFQWRCEKSGARPSESVRRISAVQRWMES